MSKWRLEHSSSHPPELQFTLEHSRSPQLMKVDCGGAYCLAKLNIFLSSPLRAGGKEGMAGGRRWWVVVDGGWWWSTGRQGQRNIGMKPTVLTDFFAPKVERYPPSTSSGQMRLFESCPQTLSRGRPHCASIRWSCSQCDIDDDENSVLCGRVSIPNQRLRSTHRFYALWGAVGSLSGRMRTNLGWRNMPAVVDIMQLTSTT